MIVTKGLVLLRQFLSSHQWMWGVFAVIALSSCVAEKKPTTVATCGNGQAFNEVTRQCYGTRSAPLATLKSLSLIQDSGRNNVILEYDDSNGDRAIACQVTHDNSSIVQVNSPKAYEAPGAAMTLTHQAQVLAHQISIINFPIQKATAEAAVEGARLKAHVLAGAVTPQEMIASIHEFSDWLKAVAAAASSTGNPGHMAGATTLITNADLFVAEYNDLSDRCLCEGGVCRTVVVPKFGASGVTGFSYTVTEPNDGTSDLATVKVTVSGINRAPLPRFQDAMIFESQTNTPLAQPLPTIHLARDMDFADDLASGIFTYTLISAPTQGSLTGCLGIGGAGLDCIYTPFDGNFSDENPHSGAYGSFGQAVFQTMEFSSTFNGSAANSIRVRLTPYLGIGFAPIHFVNVVGEASGPVIEVVILEGMSTAEDIVEAIQNHDIASQFINAHNLGPLDTMVAAGQVVLSGGSDAQDSFRYRVSDGKGMSLYEGVYSIRIREQNDFPVINLTSTLPTSTPMREDIGFTLNIAYTDVDSPLLATSCTAVPGPNLNIVSGCSCTFAGVCSVGLVGATDFSGDVYVDVSVTNDGQTSSVRRKSLTLQQVNDPPTVATLRALGNPYHVYEDDVLEIDGLTIDEGDTLGLENAQDIYLRLTIHPADRSVIPQHPNNVKIFYNNVNLNFDGSNMVMIPNSVADASAGVLKFVFTPAENMSSAPLSPVRVELFVQDNGSNIAPHINNTTYQFEIDVEEVDDPPTLTSIDRVEMNEGGYAITKPFFADEGGGPNEDVQAMTVRVTSDNPGLIPHANIEIFYDTNNNLTPDPSESIGLGGGTRALGDGVASADAHALFISVRPVDGLSGTSNIRVIASDGNSDIETTFPVVVHPIGAVHGGWSHISAVSIKDIPRGQRDPNQVCSFSTAHCNGGHSCTGTAAPNSVISADQINAVFFDSANQRCYYAATTGVNGWQEMSTFCPISRSSDVTDCSGASCIGNTSPVGSISPGTSSSQQTHRYYYRPNQNICYRSTGHTTNDWEAYFPTTVEIAWKNFILSGSGADAGVLIGGWNVYRRKSGESYNFTKPLNAVPLNAGTRAYSDRTTTENTVYYYLVRPIDNKRQLPTATQEVYSEVRVLSPPRNMAFVHRWIVNQEVCEKMHKTSGVIDSENSFRCPYAGPGEVLVGGQTYYDIGQDMLVDLVEAGCPYSNASNQDAVDVCGPNGCIGVINPNTSGNPDLASPAVSGLVFYNRSSGSCYRSSTGNTWVEFNDIGVYPSAVANGSRSVFLPPLVNLTQVKANDLCSDRTQLAASGIHGVDSNLSFKLPSRKQQMAYSAHPVGVADSQLELIERGFSLNSSSKCNSSGASGLEFAYTNAQVPSTSFSFSLPGTDASSIRSMITGSVPIGQSMSTQACVSRYGLQDIYGNVAEWVSDRFVCQNNRCTGINFDMHGAGAMVDSSNNDMKVHDSVFDYYAMDGVRGPCRDIDADGNCTAGDAPLTSWRFQDKSFDASFMSFPLALPVHRLFQVNFPPSLNDVSKNLLEIGPTSGMTVSQLHKDAAIINAEAIENNIGGNRIGGMATGGGYTDGDEAGRYSFELVPSQNVAAQAASGGTLYNGDTSASLSFTALTPGAAGNNIAVRLIDGGTAGSEGINVSASFITVFIEDGVSTRNQIRDAILAHPIAGNLVSVSVGGFNNPFNVTEDGGNLSGGLDAVDSRRPDLGFRCVVPVPASAYTPDALHNALYTGY